MLCFRKDSNESFILIKANPTFRQNAFLVEIKESVSEYEKALMNILNSLRILNNDIRPKRAFVIIKERIGRNLRNITEFIKQIELKYHVKLETVFLMKLRTVI